MPKRQNISQSCRTDNNWAATDTNVSDDSDNVKKMSKILEQKFLLILS